MPLARMAPHLDVDRGRCEEGKVEKGGQVGATVEVSEGAGLRRC